MAIPAGVKHFVFGGALPRGERWQSGFWLQGGLPSNAAAANEDARLVLETGLSTDDSGAIAISLQLLVGSAVTIDFAKMYVYAAGGPTATLIGEHTPTTVHGSASTNTLPLQIACVVSTRTGLSGRRNRGRIYLPACNAPIDSTFQFPSTVYGPLAAAWGIYFADLAASSAGTPVVVSRVGGTANQITSVQVDSRPDIQRRRVNQETIAGVAVHGAIGP
jgi:hypothetical protein